jgi:nickel/cobalt exporter
MRGRLVDAISLGVIVTLSHTVGIIVFAFVAVLTSAAVLPRLLEQYVALGTALLILGIGLGMLWSQWSRLRLSGGSASQQQEDHPADSTWHRHGWLGEPHSHAAELTSIAARPPSLGLLTGLGIAGGLMPDPGALAVLLSAIHGGRLVLGLLTVLLFSLGFASTLVVVGLLAGRAGEAVLQRINRTRWLDWLQVGTATVIAGYGLVLATGSVRLLGGA